MANHDAGSGDDDLEPELEIVEPTAAASRRFAHTLRRGGDASPAPDSDAASAIDPRDEIATTAVPPLEPGEPGELGGPGDPGEPGEPLHDGDADLAIPVALSPGSTTAIADDWWLTRPMMPAEVAETVVRDIPELLERHERELFERGGPRLVPRSSPRLIARGSPQLIQRADPEPLDRMAAELLEFAAPEPVVRVFPDATPPPPTPTAERTPLPPAARAPLPQLLGSLVDLPAATMDDPGEAAPPPASDWLVWLAVPITALAVLAMIALWLL